MAYTDLHSHLIPGVDDGVPDLPEALAAARALAAAGFGRAGVTPHLHPALYPNDPEDLKKKTVALGEAVRRAGIPIEIRAGAEHFYGDELAQLVAQRRVLHWGEERRYFLVEVAHQLPFPLDLEERLFRWRVAGFFAILAHPERYAEVRSDRKRARRLAELGVVLQVDLTSIGGKFGRPTRRLARELVDDGVVALAASDMHRVSDEKAVNAGIGWLLKRGVEERLLADAPGRIWEGKPI